MSNISYFPEVVFASYYNKPQHLKKKQTQFHVSVTFSHTLEIL